MPELTVAIDAMGGDFAPGIVVDGVIDYFRRDSSALKASIVLVGKEREIRREMKRLGAQDEPRIRIVDAHEAVSMREHFFSYWKKRKETSIQKALDLVARKEADAMISVGNTGAVMAMASDVLGNQPLVRRPALSLSIPTMKGRSLLMDVGASAESNPLNLAQYALMGRAFLQVVEGIENPKIALMNIGEEPLKGNELAKNAHNLLQKLDINFIGNIEGQDAVLGQADLIVTDGFTGNVTIKVAEGVADAIYSLLKKEVATSWMGRFGFFLIKRALKRVWRKLDYSEYGGALLLGVNGVVVIGHGRSNARAITSAIELAVRFVRDNVLGKISHEITNLESKFKELQYV